MRWAVESEEVSDPFLWWDDDVFLMQPLDSVPLMHRGLNSKFLDMLRNDKRRATTFNRTTRTQAFMVRHFGSSIDFYCYEVHVPIVIHKELAKETLNWIRTSTAGLSKRTVYGNLCAIMTGEEGFEIVDPKVPVERKFNEDATWLSTNDYSFSNCEIGNHIRGKFSGERSIWENDEQVEKYRYIR
jgi:hypothetical protein